MNEEGMEFVLYLWLLADTNVNYQSCVHVHRGLRVLEEIRGRNCRSESTNVITLHPIASQ